MSNFFHFFSVSLYKIDNKMAYSTCSRVKKLTSFLLFIGLIGAFSVTQSSCKTAEGCQMEGKYQAKTDKNGNLSTKKGKSGLWSKKQQKRMSKGK